MLSEKKQYGSLAGRASAKATENYAARFGLDFTHDFFRDLGMVGRPLRVSSLGLGTYLGECDDSDDARYASSVRRAVEVGVNFLDTAINYRCQRSERAVGRALRDAVAAAAVKRDEIVVCTKGGYIPLDSTPPASREAYQAYLKMAYFDPGIMQPADVVAGGHCLAPSYLADQIARSRANLGLQTIDVYYLHNPEQQLDAVTAGEFRNRIRAAFALLESECSSGSIGCYGCATWNGFRLTQNSRGHLSLADLVKIATEEGGSRHHFRAIQLPINLALTEAIRVPTQRLATGREVTLLDAARELRVSVIASGSLMQGKLSAGLPAQIVETIPGLATDAQRAVAFVRALPGVTAALVGMKSVAHLEENLGAVRAKAT